MRFLRRSAAALAAIVLLTAVAQAQVVLASKIDTEGSILGHIIRLVLESHGVPVENRISMGGTPVVRTALVAGSIDLYPEYTGNAALFFGLDDDPVWNGPVKGYEMARKLDYDANRLVWLAPAPANNTWAIAVRRDFAEANGVRTMSDFAAYVRGGGSVRLVASAEFVNSPVALALFQETYQFLLQRSQLLTLQGGDTKQTIAAAVAQAGGANAAMVYRTDGGIAAAGLQVLEDDLSVQPVYRPAPVLREEVLIRYPNIPAVLAPVFARLDQATLQVLNGRVQVEGEDPSAVAQSFLKSNGFLP